MRSTFEWSLWMLLARVLISKWILATFKKMQEKKQIWKNILLFYEFCMNDLYFCYKKAHKKKNPSFVVFYIFTWWTLYLTPSISLLHIRSAYLYSDSRHHIAYDEEKNRIVKFVATYTFCYISVDWLFIVLREWKINK